MYIIYQAGGNIIYRRSNAIVASQLWRNLTALDGYGVWVIALDTEGGDRS